MVAATAQAARATAAARRVATAEGSLAGLTLGE
jgi:hypothetical protein